MYPKDIVDLMDMSVIGQSDAKSIISNAIYTHLIRCENRNVVSLPKTNILMVGPTGTGKTHIAKTLAKELNLPIAIADATSLTQAGYVGEDVENCLLRLIQAADGNVYLAEQGIIFIDEIDKIGRKQESPSITRDVGGEGVQQALLKIIEGSVVNVPASGGRKRPDGVDYIPIDTSNILFICAGAFEGIDYNNVTQSELVKFGMMPELLGRLPAIAKLNSITKQDMYRILSYAKDNILEQWINLFNLHNIVITVTDEAKQIISEYAATKNIGARALVTVLEEVFRDLLQNIHDLDSEILVDDKFILNTFNVSKLKSL